MDISEIIMETLEYYGVAPEEKRGIKKWSSVAYNEHTKQHENTERSSCQYVVTNGETKYCAVGRCMTDQAKAWAGDVAGGITDLISEWWSHNWKADEYMNSQEYGEYDEYQACDDREQEEAPEVYMDDMLMPEYQGQSQNFWESLQELHDEAKFWNGGGKEWLTIDGYYHIRDMVDAHIAEPVERQNLLNAVKPHVEDFEHEVL